MYTLTIAKDYLDSRNMSMTIHRGPKVKTVICMVCLFFCVLSHAGVCAKTNTLTFFAWSDQHVKTDGNGEHLISAIDAMNKLPQRDYPVSIGDKVDEPDFVIGLGDITEWPTHAAKDTYEKLITKRLRFPSYDVAGNHDSGGSAPSQTIHDWLIKRHGALSYTFDKKGVHFIALYSKYDESLNNPAQPISEDALEYLRTNLSKVLEDTPIVVATHLCFESITNKDEFADAFGDVNVILVLGGHYHKASVNQYRGINFVQLPSPAPGSPSEFTVIRIDSERLIAVPFDYEKGEWSTDPKKILNAQIRGPRKISVSCQSAPDHDNVVKYQSLLLDTHFRRGFLLSYPDSRKGAAVEAILDLGNSNNKPAWRLCQWGTKHTLAKAHCIRDTNGDISYENKAKRVLVGAESSDNRDLILEIKSSAEYGNRARKYGESWPHLLVEQKVCKIYPLDQLAKLQHTLKIKLLYSENHMIQETYSPALHAAQFQMFLVVRNINEQSKDCGSYYWFGVPFYDSRYDIPPPHKAKDGGKADATGKFIYTIAGEQVNTKHLKENEWAQIDMNLLPYIEAGLEEAAKRGHLKSSKPGDYAVTEMNIGWEAPGTFDASIQIQDLEISAILR
ncbi:MAG: metallophosphoesterase family protein [Planctomycetota bacterium]